MNYCGSWSGVSSPPLQWDGGVLIAGVPGECVVVHHRLHFCARSAPTMCASHAVMELRPMIHGGKRASVFHETPRQVPVGVAMFLGGTPESAVHRVEGAHEIAAGARGRGQTVALSRREPSMHQGRRAVRRAEKLLQPVVADLPRKVTSRSMCWRNSSKEVPPGRS